MYDDLRVELGLDHCGADLALPPATNFDRLDHLA